MKLLSIAIPCYNSQDYMEKCIESLLVGGEVHAEATYTKTLGVVNLYDIISLSNI